MRKQLHENYNSFKSINNVNCGGFLALRNRRKQTVRSKKLLSLKKLIHTELPESNVILSNIIDRSDSGITRLKISNLNKHLNSLKIDITDKSNISSEHLNGSGLHLNRHGKGKFAMNLIKNSENCVEKTLVEIDYKVDSLWLGLNSIFQIVYVIMIVKGSRIQQVLYIFYK